MSDLTRTYVIPFNCSISQTEGSQLLEFATGLVMLSGNVFESVATARDDECIDISQWIMLT